MTTLLTAIYAIMGVLSLVLVYDLVMINKFKEEEEIEKEIELAIANRGLNI